jgi:hypothetical protein
MELTGHLCSDNGGNFVETSRELKALFKSAEFEGRRMTATKTQFQWHFIPPISPHFWRNVGSWRQVPKV